MLLFLYLSLSLQMRQKVSIFSLTATVSPKQYRVPAFKLQFNEELRPDLINGLESVSSVIQPDLTIFFVIKTPMGTV
ncbi:hypothetical protein L4B77_12415 [Vibrio minamisatsumaniensis]